jgi:rubrerythrin
MMYDVTANDVFEMAVQLERNGAKFYGEAAQNTENPAYKKLLAARAKMEIGHEKTFSELRSELWVNEKASTVFDPQNESAFYFRAPADTNIFLKKRLIFHP